MKLDLKKRNQNQRVLNHLIFWVITLFFLAVTNNIQVTSLNYQSTLIVSLFLLPVHFLYFYTIAYCIVPKYLEKKHYTKMILSTIALAVLVLFLYRLTEIFIIGPYISLINVDQTIVQQLTNPYHLINAFEKSNLIVWFAVSIKFLKMWHERKQLTLQTELNFLKAQIHPHFLFNTLNNLYALTLTNSSKSSSIVIGLSEILRYMLNECNTENVKLARDIEILKNYVMLEEIRYGDRLDLNLSITGNLDNLYVPPLLMLPLVENAFKYGTSEMLKNAWITINISVTAPNQLKFKVANSKPLQKNQNSEIHFKKIGLKNVRRRLDILYKDAYQLNIYNEDELFAAILEINLNNKCINTNGQGELKNHHKQNGQY
ncbi:sensor histidine kinase [Pedobacter frigoris]|uniref:Histidine kinase n=1 Tax=Pedobacter frigoris TaxID=2571272 RepID=A0A4U1CPQ6_9SPHI|nr:histidine kinase [Pedobacter frigoris]TKC07465.1 histidine kinase [Pedobacter frigoris]